MSSEIRVEHVRQYTPQLAHDLGRLMVQLDPRFTIDPSQELLEYIIASPDRAQLVAYSGEQVVGAATMNTVAGPGKGLEGWLEDFVVDAAARGSGVADRLWDDGMLAWCRRQALPGFSFETEAERRAAIRFYERKGAQLVPGTTTHYTVAVDK